MTRDDFNNIYWAAQPPAVRALKDMPNGPDKQNAAVALAKQGFTVDTFIGFFGFEPWGTMSARQMEGLRWAPALLMDVHMVPNPLTTDQVGPNTPMPPGAIKTSLDPADYPPFDPPPQPASVTKVADPVGPGIPGVNIYMDYSNGTWNVGETYKDDTGTYVKKSQQTPFGPRMWWEKVG